MIMNNDKVIFPEVWSPKCTYITKDEKYKYYYPIVIKCFDNVIQNKKTSAFFKGIGVKSIVLYAVNELSKYLCFDIENESDICVNYICDKNADKFPGTIYGKRIFDISYFCNDYKNSNVEKIVICNLLYENEIVQDLMERGVLLEDIILFPNVIYNLE